MGGIMQTLVGSFRATAAGAAAAALVYDLDAATYTGLSASFNGTSQYLSASNAAFTFTGDFTVEGWFRPSSVAGLRTLFTIGAPTAATGALVVYSNTGTLQAQPYGGGNITFSGATMSVNTWYHIALVRSGSTIRLYFNGTAHATTITNSSSIGNGAFTVGFLSGGYGYFAGQISTVRVTASAVYTGNFTSPTSPLTVTQSAGTNISAITAGQTQFLLPLNATPFTDSSTNALTVTNTGTVVPGVQYPFTSTDATGTYALSITNAGSISVSPQQSSGSAQFVKANVTNLSTTVTAPSTDSITYEWWFRASAVASTNGMLQTRTSTSGADGIDVSVFDGAISVSTSGTFLLQAGAVVANTWYHIAVVRNGTTAFTVYLNGTSIGTFNKTGLTGTQLYLGIKSAGSAGEAFGGYISNFRYVKGTAVYTGAFTPPEQPPTAISGTNLLLLVNSSGTLLTDSSGNNRTVTNNNSVAYSALNPWSGYFSKTNNVGTDVIYGGPNYVTGQSYTVFMAYQLSSVSAGRLLNTQSEASKDWLMGAYNGNPKTFYPNFSVNLPGSGADTVWHLDWATWNTTTGVGNLYASTSTAPSAVTFTATNAGGGGFNQLRMFSRSAGSEVQSGNIAFIKVYNGVLTLAEIQALHATYKTRFGY